MTKRNNYSPNDSSAVFLWVLLMTYILSFAISIVYIITANQMGVTGDEFLKYKPIVYINAAITEVFFVIVYFVYMHNKRISVVKANKLDKKLSWQQIAILIVTAGLLYVLSSPILNCFEYFMQEVGFQLKSLEITLDNPFAIIYTILFLGLLPAFIEELIFRGAVMQGLRKYGKWTAIIVSALLFMLMHGNAQQSIYQFGCGILFGLLVWETGSIWASIIVHAVNNCLVIVLQSLVDCGVIESGSMTMTWTYAVLALILLAALILLLWFVIKLLKKYSLNNRDKLQQTNTEQNSSKTQQQNVMTSSEAKQEKILINKKLFEDRDDRRAINGIIWAIVIAFVIELINIL